MRRIRYSVAASLDGSSRKSDCILMTLEIDFEAWSAEFDTVLMGRGSFEASGAGAWGQDMQITGKH